MGRGSVPLRGMSTVVLLVLSPPMVMELAPSTLPAFLRNGAHETQCSALDASTGTGGHAVCPYSMVFLS